MIPDIMQEMFVSKSKRQRFETKILDIYIEIIDKQDGQNEILVREKKNFAKHFAYTQY